MTERPGGRGGGRDRGERGERGERAERTLSDTIGADAPRDRDASIEILGDVAAFDRSSANGHSDGDTGVGGVGGVGAAEADAAETDSAGRSDSADRGAAVDAFDSEGGDQ